MNAVCQTNDTVHSFTFGTAWDLSTLSYDGVGSDLNVSLIESNPQNLWMKDDGTKMYIGGFITDKIHEFTCSTPFDPSSCTDDADPLDLTALGNHGQTAMSADGTKLYVSLADSIEQYSCTAWDISTCTDDNETLVLTGKGPGQIFWQADGERVVITDLTADVFLQYSCSTAWLISSCTYENVSLDYSNEDTHSNGLFLNSDYSVLIHAGSTLGTEFYEYE